MANPAPAFFAAFASRNALYTARDDPTTIIASQLSASSKALGRAQTCQDASRCASTELPPSTFAQSHAMWLHPLT